MNSIIVRGQDQLHIHIGCLLPYARRSLEAAAPQIPIGGWARIGAVVPHTMFWAYRIRATDLANAEPFRLVGEAFAGRARSRGDLTIMVAGVRVEGDDQFLILASYAHAPGAWWPVGSDDLLGLGLPRRAGRCGGAEGVSARATGERVAAVGRPGSTSPAQAPYWGVPFLVGAKRPWTLSFRPTAVSTAPRPAPHLETY